MKPIIFFSHSSRDKNVLEKLKTQILDESGNSVDIFLSSDGDSIPFGKNWIHEIEEKLNCALIMFVFLSPNSINSKWIYFETGFSYSKEIQVIPVGFLGIDLNDVTPPMNLLQGFNLNSHLGMNNLITIINKKFGFKHKESFAKQDYEDLMLKSNSGLNLSNSKYINTIDEIRLGFSNTIGSKRHEHVLKEYPEKLIKKYFSDNEINFRVYDNEISSHGLLIKLESKNTYNKTSNRYKISVDPHLYKLNFLRIKNLLSILYKPPLSNYDLYVIFKSNFMLLKEDYKISSRLHEYDIKMEREGGRTYKYENISFAIDNLDDQSSIIKTTRETLALRIIYKINDLDNIPLFSLIELLLNTGVLYDTN